MIYKRIYKELYAHEIPSEDIMPTEPQIKRKVVKVSKKIIQEVDFLCTYFMEHKGYYPAQKEIEEYVESTVLGTKKAFKGGVDGISAPLFQAKRSLDMSIKMWRKDLVDGILDFSELEENYGNHPYGDRLLKSIHKGLCFQRYQVGEGFPEITVSNILFKSHD